MKSQLEAGAVTAGALSCYDRPHQMLFPIAIRAWVICAISGSGSGHQTISPIRSYAHGGRNWENTGRMLLLVAWRDNPKEDLVAEAEAVLRIAAVQSLFFVRLPIAHVESIGNDPDWKSTRLNSRHL